MHWDFQNAKYIKKPGPLYVIFGCGKNPWYKKMLAKATSSVKKELDLIKFIQRQRLQTFTTLSVFNSRQKYVADKMSTMIIRESSDLNDQTEDDFELEQENLLDIQNHSRTIFNSQNQVSQRLIEAYKVKRWKEDFKYNKGRSSAYAMINNNDVVERLQTASKVRKIAPTQNGSTPLSTT